MKKLPKKCRVWIRDSLYSAYKASNHAESKFLFRKVDF
jgi:hypothetical protein